MGQILHDQQQRRGAFVYEEDGVRKAEMVYMMQEPDLMIILHTDVDESLAGQGIGKKLLEQLVLYVRQSHIRVIARCPFAHATFKRMKEWQDVLAEQ